MSYINKLIGNIYTNSSQVKLEMYIFLFSHGKSFFLNIIAGVINKK